MRRLLTCLAAATVLAPAPAHALLDDVWVATALAISTAPSSGFDYFGGCAFENVRQFEATGNSWVGAVEVAIVPTRNGLPANVDVTDVRCDFFLNTVPQGTVLTAPNGIGLTANAGRFEYSAGVSDSATVCTYATVADVVMPPLCATAVPVSLP